MGWEWTRQERPNVKRIDAIWQQPVPEFSRAVLSKKAFLSLPDVEGDSGDLQGSMALFAQRLGKPARSLFERVRFNSTLLPPYLKRARSVEEL